MLHRLTRLSVKRITDRHHDGATNQIEWYKKPFDRQLVWQHPHDLAKHDCLTLSSEASQTRGWAFKDGDEVVHVRPSGPLDCSDGQVLHDWCLAGHGIAWRSTWEVEAEIDAGLLVSLLDDFAAPPNGIYAVFPQRKHLPLRVRLWIDFLKHHYGRTDFWKTT